MAGRKKPAKKQAKKNKSGAPSRYLRKYCDMMVEYFTREPVTFLEKKQYFADGSIKSVEPIPWAASMPTFQGFAATIKVECDTLRNWCEKYPEFRKAYNQAKQLQEYIWLVNGMSGLYNPSFAQFFGKNCLGYKDKQEIDARVAGKVSEEDAEQAMKALGYGKIS